MAEQLCKLFKQIISDIVPNVQKREVVKHSLNSMDAKNMTDSQFFDGVRNSLKIPIHKIEIGENKEKKLNSYEYFYLGANEWKTTDIEELLKVETCILLLKFGSTFGYFTTFTTDCTHDVRINLFLNSELAIMVQIGIDLLMKDPYTPKLRYMCENLNVFSENSFGKKLFQVLHETKRNKGIAFILENECLFPPYPNEQQIPLVEKRLKSNKEFHEYIKTEDHEAIEQFLKATPNQRYINNEDNESACAVAIKMKNYLLYSFLHQRNLTVRNYESKLLQDKDFLYFFHDQKIPHEEYSEKVLQTLTLATFIVDEKKTNLNLYEIYKQLIQIPKFELVLNIIYKLIPINIIVDCKEENNSKICPYVSGQTSGLYDSRLNRISIFGSGRTEQMLGTFAHEFTHFAMDLLYNNNAEPYQSSDDKRKRDYTEIVGVISQKVKDGQVNEEIIQQIYNTVYSKAASHADLIVCVNHIIAFYGNKKGTQILKEEAPELFKFYNDNIVPDLENYLRSHFNCNDFLFNPFSMQGIESKCKKYKFKSNNLLALVTQTNGHVLIETNCVHLTCMKLFSNITATDSVDYNLNNTLIIDLKKLSTNIKQSFIAHYQKYELLIVADQTVENQSDVNAWTNIKDYVDECGKRFIFVFEKEETLPFRTSIYKDIFKWTDFDEKSQKLIYNKLKVNFQGYKINFKELIDYEENSDVLNDMLSVDLIRNFIFAQSIPTVGTKRLRNSEHYIERELNTTLFELDELTDEITIKYYCENITDESSETNFKLKTYDGKLITFPGKTLTKIWDASDSLSSVESSVQNSTELVYVYDDIKTDIYILTSSNCATTSIIIDGDKEILMWDFSYIYLKTLHENNTNFQIHWFQESETRPYFYHHLKTFGLVDKIRCLHYQEKYIIDEYELFKKLEHQQINLIAATVGLGKTESIKSLAQRLVRNNSSTWAPVVILRRNTELLQNFDDKKANLDNIFDFLAKFLQLKSNLEKEMFKYCCHKKNSNVFLFLDGADEISPIYTEKIYKIIEILSKTNIKRITVSVRLNIKNEFETNLNTVAIELKPLTHDDQIRFMSNIWRDEKIDNLEKISRRVINQFRGFDNFLNNPLQIELVANVCHGELNGFSKKLHTIPGFFADKTTLMEIYAKFIDQKLRLAINERLGWNLYKRYSATLREKKNYIKNTKKQVKHAAIITLLDDEEVKLFLSHRDIEENTEFLNEVKQLVTYDGIVDGIISGKLNFVHRTYAEYFFADFLINDWENWRTKEGEYFFFDVILVKQQFKYVRKFLNSYLGTSDFLSRKPYFQISVTLHDAVVQNIEENNTKILKNLYKLGFNLTINPSSLITKHINNNSPNSIEKLIETITDLVTNCDNVHLSINEFRQLQTILHRILPYDCYNLIKALLKCTIIDLSDDELQKYQIELFRSLWKKAMTAYKDNEIKELFELFKEIVEIGL